MQDVAYPKNVGRFHDSDLLTKVMTFFQDRDERAKRRSVFWYFADGVLGRSRARNQSRRPPGRNERSRNVGAEFGHQPLGQSARRSLRAANPAPIGER